MVSEYSSFPKPQHSCINYNITVCISQARALQFLPLSWPSPVHHSRLFGTQTREGFGYQSCKQEFFSSSSLTRRANQCGGCGAISAAVRSTQTIRHMFASVVRSSSIIAIHGLWHKSREAHRCSSARAAPHQSQARRKPSNLNRFQPKLGRSHLSRHMPALGL